MAWLGRAWRGEAWPGKVWRGKGPNGAESEGCVFERVERIQEQIDRVYDLTLSLGRGDILEHSAISAVLGLQPHEGSWGHIVGRARRQIEDVRGIATWYEPRVGYKLLTETEQINGLPVWRTKRAFRQLGKGLRSVAALPEAGLTLNQRKAKAVQVHLLTDRQRSMRRDLKEQKALLALRPVMPRRPTMEGEPKS